MKRSRSKGFSVYLITNTVNGKKYVGKTCADLPTRWQEHRRAAFRNDTSNRPLFNAIRKYGSGAFTIELLQSADNEQEVNDMEVLWIAKLGLAESSGFSRRYFRTLVQRLVIRGHVELLASGRGSRRTYRLTDPIFARYDAEKKQDQAIGLFCGGCQKPMRGAVCEDCMRRIDLADAI